jgi:hypothetical protein
MNITVSHSNELWALVLVALGVWWPFPKGRVLASYVACAIAILLLLVHC